MDDAPRISVLLPVFDAAETLAACLRSIRRQTETRWECVVVDDGSRDGSLAVARAAAAAEPRVRVLARPHRGVAAAANDGADACRAPFVARMDADDLMHRDRLRAQLAAFAADPTLAAVGCHPRLFPRAALGDGMRAYERWLATVDTPERVRREAWIELPVANPTLTFRAELLRTHRYRDCGWPEDYDLLLRLLACGARVGVVPRRLHAWRQRPDSLSRTSPVYATARFTACKAWYLARGPLAAHERYVLWGYGGTGRALCRALGEQGRRPSAIVELHPGRLGNTIQGAPVIAPEALRQRRGEPIVVSVSGETARARIRAALAGMAFREGDDYFVTA